MMFKSAVTDSCALLKFAFEHITPKYASQWKVIGFLLDVPLWELENIEAGYPTNVKWCCNQMFVKWLESDTSASQEKLIEVINSPALSMTQSDSMVNRTVYST